MIDLLLSFIIDGPSLELQLLSFILVLFNANVYQELPLLVGLLVELKSQLIFEIEVI